MLRLIAFTLFMTVGLAASIWSRFAALLMYVWFALFRPQEWVFTDISWLRLSLVLGLLLLGPSLATGILPNISHPLSIGAILLVLSSVIAQLTTSFPGAGWAWVDMFARLVIVACLAVTLLNSRMRIVLFIGMIAAAMGFHSAKAGVAFLLAGGTVFAEGLGGAYSDNNGYAMAIAMTIPLILVTYQNLRFGWPFEGLVRMGLLAAVPLSALTVIGTKSRAGFLALIIMVLAYIALVRRRLRALAIVTAVVAIGLVAVPLPEGYFDRIQTITTYEEVNEESAISRLHFWRVALRMAADNPLGVGPRNFDHVYNRYDFLFGQHGSGRSVHSSHFQVLAELGYAAFLVWICLFAYAFWIALRLRRRAMYSPGIAEEDRSFFFTTANALLVSMSTFLVGGSFIALAFNDLTWYTFAVLAAVDRLAASQEARARNEAIGSAYPDAFQQRVASA